MTAQIMWFSVDTSVAEVIGVVGCAGGVGGLSSVVGLGEATSGVMLSPQRMQRTAFLAFSWPQWRQNISDPPGFWLPLLSGSGRTHDDEG
ncbi:MAG: hypothetical protein R3F12_01635 [Lysobacteraceae bacterium]